MLGNKSKILVANNYLNNFGGSETFTYTLIEELLKRGYEVEYFTFEKGLFSDKIEKNLAVSFMSKKKYDLILANHNTCVKFLFDKGFVIQTCHGIYPPLEQPSIYADAYVSISQEVQTHLANRGFSSRIIYNGINAERFYPKKDINKNLKTVLSLCHSEEANNMVEKACNQIGLSFKQRNKYDGAIWDIQNEINEADLVVGLGRSAYEAMSCGRPTVIFDKRKYMESFSDGYVTHILGLSLQNNCSGRYSKLMLTEIDLAKEFLKYNAEDGKTLREFILKELDIKKAVDQYFDYFTKISQIKTQRISYNNIKNITTKKFSIRLLEIKQYIDKISKKINF